MTWKKTIASSVAVMAVLALNGCGGNNDNGKNADTGYYLDSAVAGVSFKCGTQTGVTGEDGKFTFKKGVKCEFTLAGIPLRTTLPEELEDGVKVVEDDPRVAQLLQSIDSDGDLSNGIQISPDVLKAITDALKDLDKKDELPEGDDLKEVVKKVKEQVPTAKGYVPIDEVRDHLKGTQTKVTKELLAGKTFYFDDKSEVAHISFNEGATQVTVTNSKGSKTHNITIDGWTITFDGSDTHDAKMEIVKSLPGEYILFGEKGGTRTKKLYYKQEDAKKELSSESSDNKGGLDAKMILAGKTLYYRDDDGEIKKLIINADATSLTLIADGESKTASLKINGATVTVTPHHSTDKPFSATITKFVHGKCLELKGGGRFYFLRSEAVQGASCQ